jgi:hypothetical protein
MVQELTFKKNKTKYFREIGASSSYYYKSLHEWISGR